MISERSNSTGHSDSSNKWMAKLCIEPSMDLQNCVLAVFCPCILVGKIHWRIKQKESNLDPLQSLYHRNSCCNSSCCSSFFCLCPWYVTKYHSNVRSLYAIGGKKNSKFKNCVCCTCILLQLDREIRAREGETRLRTDASYHIDPVLTQPELSLPMKYISPCEARPRPDNENVLSVRGSSTKIRKMPNPTKRFTTEKALERRLLILRDIYSNEGLAIERPLEVELGTQNYNHIGKPNQQTLAPQYWNIELTEYDMNSSNNGLAGDPLSDCPTNLTIGKEGKLKQTGLPHLNYAESITIETSNENSPLSRSLSPSNFSQQNSLEFIVPQIHVKDPESSSPPNSIEDKPGQVHSKILYSDSIINKDSLNKESSSSDSSLLGKLNEGNHSRDPFDVSAVTVINVNEANHGAPVHPNFYSDPVDSYFSVGYSVPVTMSDKTETNQSTLEEDPDETKLMSCKTTSLTTIVDIPKTRSQKVLDDKALANFAYGTADHSLTDRCVTRGPQWRSGSYKALDQIEYSLEDKVFNSDESGDLQIQQQETGKCADIHDSIESSSQIVLHHDSSDLSASLSRNSNKISLKFSDHPDLRLNFISKLPICINQEIRRNQLFSRPKLSPILSNENIYRQREKDSRILTHSDLEDKNREIERGDHRYRPSDSAHANNFPSTLSSEYLELMSQTQIVPEHPKENVNLPSEDESRPKTKDKDLSVGDQAAKRALRLILVRSSSGVTD